MSLFDSMKIAQMGLSTQRIRMQAVSSNLANISSTETPEGGPYRRRQVVVSEVPLSRFSDYIAEITSPGIDADASGVRATEITLDPSPFISKYEPDHPHANAQGYVEYPNVNPAIEMVDMVNISRSYEANLAVIRSVKQMISGSLDMLRV